MTDEETKASVDKEVTDWFAKVRKNSTGKQGYQKNEGRQERL
jgi:hypothetical protein